MCLEVAKSHVRKPISEMECFKLLRFEDGRWVTPFRYTPVDPSGAGWFISTSPAKRKIREYLIGDLIYGGYIHALTSPNGFISRCETAAIYEKLPSRPKQNDWVMFHAVAREVVAVGPSYDGDLVCRALYIPAFDLTGANRSAIVDYTQLAKNPYTN